MAREKQSERGRMRYGMCLNDQCTKCKTKEVQAIPTRKEMICAECGKPLRECPPPKPPVNKGLIIGIIAAILVIGGGIGVYFGLVPKEGTNDTDKTGADIIVAEPPVVVLESIAISEKSKTLTKGEECELSATLTPADSVVMNWESTNVDVATVDEGKVTTLAIGTTRIIVSAEKDGKAVADTCMLTVDNGGSSKPETGTSGISLSFGTYDGGQREGYPHGNGTVTFTKQHTFKTSSGDLIVKPGETITGNFRDGMLNHGELTQKSGNTVVVKGIRIK